MNMRATQGNMTCMFLINIEQYLHPKIMNLAGLKPDMHIAKQYPESLNTTIVFNGGGTGLPFNTTIETWVETLRNVYDGGRESMFSYQKDFTYKKAKYTQTMVTFGHPLEGYGDITSTLIEQQRKMEKMIVDLYWEDLDRYQV